MVKKDYVKLETILAGWYTFIPNEFIEDIIKWLKEDSNKFNEKKFIKAVNKDKE